MRRLTLRNQEGRRSEITTTRYSFPIINFLCNGNGQFAEAAKDVVYIAYAVPNQMRTVLLKDDIKQTRWPL